MFTEILIAFVVFCSGLEGEQAANFRLCNIDQEGEILKPAPYSVTREDSYLDRGYTEQLAPGECQVWQYDVDGQVRFQIPQMDIDRSQTCRELPLGEPPKPIERLYLPMVQMNEGIAR